MTATRSHRCKTSRGGKKGATRRGSALLLTLFTVAALLTLGTTFIAISIGESRQTRNDREMQLARGVAMYGISWVTSYMALPTAWITGTQRDTDTGNADKQYTLHGTNFGSGGTNNQIAWLGRTLSFGSANNANNAFHWVIRRTTGTGSEVTLQDGLTGTFELEVERIKADGSNNLARQSAQYLVTSTACVFSGAPVYNTDGTADRTQAAAVRVLKMRIRAQNPLDFAIYESNMRSWNIPGFNTQFGQNERTDNGLGIIDPSTAPNGSQKQKNLQYQVDLLDEMYRKVQLDSIGIPQGYQMKGNFRCDGVANAANDPFASVAGSVRMFATNETELKTINFTGSQVSFANGQTNLYNGTSNLGSASNSALQSVFPGKSYQADCFRETRGLPAVADYMRGPVADTSVWGSGSPNGVAAPVSMQDGWAYTEAKTAPNSTTGEVSGYIKVATPLKGAVEVTQGVGDSTGGGADVEIPTGGGIQAPGFARIKIEFQPDGQTVKIQKIGAYSGKPVAGAQYPYDGQSVPVNQIQKRMLYVDGGNVEVSGTVPPNFTVVSAASSDRPTVASPGAPDPNDSTRMVPQSGLPILIRPDQHGQFANTIYKDPNDALFKSVTDANGKITQVPVKDSNGKFWWPAYDPTKAGEQSGNPAAVTSEAPLVREGNVSIVGNLQKASGGSGTLGIVAQNYILLSDQTGSSNLKVDAVLMSMNRSVQYGGFLTASSSDSKFNPYYQQLGANVASNGAFYGNMPKPKTAVSNGKFELNGSIIGQYADVESTTGGVGYTSQVMKQDASLRSSMPSLFPNFSRDQMKSLITWVVVAVSDSAATKEGTKR